MTAPELIAIILSSAGVSSLINIAHAAWQKRKEFARQDEQFALRLTEMKHQQLMAVQEWRIAETGKPGNVELWDPLQTVIGYSKGLAEFRRTGKWKKADTSHRPPKI